MSPSLMNLYLEGKRNTEKITISQSDDAYHENKERQGVEKYRNWGWGYRDKSMMRYFKEMALSRGLNDIKQKTIPTSPESTCKKEHKACKNSVQARVG